GGDVAILGGTSTVVNNTILGSNTGGAIVVIPSVAFSAAITIGSPIITPVGPTSVFVGQTITGPAFTAGATIQAIHPRTGAITLSATASIPAGFTNPVPLQASGTLTGGYNLIADSTYAIAGLTHTVHADPQLGALTNNGGPTQTMALPAG